LILCFSIVDEDFYGDRINSYSDELRFLGVHCGINGMQDIVRGPFQASGFFCNEQIAFSLLLFLGFLKESKMLDEHG